MDLQRWCLGDGPQVLSSWWTAFPSSWWRELLPDSVVTLAVDSISPVRLVGRRSGGRDESLTTINGTTRVDLPMSRWDWLWLEQAEHIRSISWSVDDEVPLSQVIAIVPTFGREADAVTQTRSFLSSVDIRRVLVVDQGDTLRDHADFIELQATNGDRVKLLEQRNFGGSGGYARGMLESDPDCAILLSDDDAALPAEGLRRMLVAQAFAAREERELIMATPMFSAENPAELISAAERVDPHGFQWGAADGLREPVSVDRSMTEVIDTLAIRHAPNYAGWWGALLPPGTVAEVGLPAPFFLKWDDAEFGLRATERGYEFMALPGTGVWHPTWGAHKTLTTWVAVLLHRNRLATASAYVAGRGIVRDSLVHQIKHVLSLQYDVAELWAAGIDQFLSGPEWLGNDLAEARTKAQKVVDSLLQEPVRGDVPRPRPPSSTPLRALRAVVGLFRQRGSSQSSCIAANFTWHDGIGADRVVLTAGDGEPVSELRHDAQRARRILSTTFKQHASLARRWKELTPRYRSMLERNTTPEYWRGVLGIRR